MQIAKQTSSVHRWWANVQREGTFVGVHKRGSADNRHRECQYRPEGVTRRDGCSRLGTQTERAKVVGRREGSRLAKRMLWAVDLIETTPMADLNAASGKNHEQGDPSQETARPMRGLGGLLHCYCFVTLNSDWLKSSARRRTCVKQLGPSRRLPLPLAWQA